MNAPPPLQPIAERYRRIWKRLLWHRRKFAALSAAIAVFAILDVVRPPAPQTVRVIVARHDLAAGATVTANDLLDAAWPRSLAPTHLVERHEVVGRTLTSGVARGLPLTRLSVAGDAWSGLPPGHVAVAVRLQDSAMAGLLAPGQRVRLAAIDPRSPSEARDVSGNALVLAIPQPETRTASTQTGRLVVFDVPVEESELVVSSAVSRYLTVIWGG